MCIQSAPDKGQILTYLEDYEELRFKELVEKARDMCRENGEDFNIRSHELYNKYVAFGEVRKGYGKRAVEPIGVMSINETNFTIEPHVAWFPWVTARDKVVNFKRTMIYLSDKKEVILMVEDKEKLLFEYFVRKGDLRKVGCINNLPMITAIHIYQYNRRVAR